MKIRRKAGDFTAFSVTNQLFLGSPAELPPVALPAEEGVRTELHGAGSGEALLEKLLLTLTDGPSRGTLLAPVVSDRDRTHLPFGKTSSD